MYIIQRSLSTRARAQLAERPRVHERVLDAWPALLAPRARAVVRLDVKELEALCEEGLE